MTYNGYKLPKIKTEISDLVTLGDAKSVKAHIVETKFELDDYLIRMLEKSENDLQIRYNKVFEIVATYYDNYTMPVLQISALASDKKRAYDQIFIEVFTNEAEGSTANRYTETA